MNRQQPTGIVWRRLNRAALGAIAVAFIAGSGALCAQLNATSSAGPAIGKVADGAAGTGTTTFTVTSAGVVTQAGGAVVRVTSGTAINNLLFTCTNVAACNNYVVKIVASGSPLGRMNAVTAFTVAAGSPAPQSLTAITGSGTGTLTFTVSVGQNLTGQVHIGMNVPILDNSSTAATGAASSSFSVSSVTAGFTAGSGSATATVSRAISLANPFNLVFGTIVKPALAGGSGTVGVDKVTGLRTMTGTIAADASTGPMRATYTVSGEGGQTFSLNVPASVSMASGGNSLVVTLTATSSGSQTLSSAAGSAGTFPLGVGGSFPVSNTTPSGVYSGSFVVTVTYN